MTSFTQQLCALQSIGWLLGGLQNQLLSGRTERALCDEKFELSTKERRSGRQAADQSECTAENNQIQGNGFSKNLQDISK